MAIYILTENQKPLNPIIRALALIRFGIGLGFRVALRGFSLWGFWVLVDIHGYIYLDRKPKNPKPNKSFGPHQVWDWPWV